jgi:signal transduction histidine kinase
MGSGPVWSRVPPGVRIAGREALVVGVSVGCVLLSHPTGIWYAVPAALIASALLPLRLRWPWLAMLVSLVALSGELGLAPAAFALYRIGRTTRSVVVRWGWLAAAVLVPQLTVALTLRLSWQDATLSALFSLSWAVAPLAAGVLVRTRQDLRGSLAELRRAREAELAARADQATAEERARIGQEIHDSVGHHATLIAVEAAALAATSSDPEVREAAQRIRDQAKASLAEMRTALGLTGPQPSPDVAELISRVRGAGMLIDYADESPDGDLAPPIRRAVFRIVQESLTNAAKHAPGAEVSVRVREENGECTVVIASHPPTVQPPSPGDSRSAEAWPQGGLGITGMIERARTLGGDLRVERNVDGVYTVRARLPLRAGTPSKVGGPNPTIGGVRTARNVG